ncbi:MULTISPECIES: hypothetical protein [Vagococcus]
MIYVTPFVLPLFYALILYFIIREAVTNGIKNARKTRKTNHRQD